MHLILQTDDALTDKGSAKKHSAPPEYLEKRKQERERRRSETGLRQKFRKGVRKFDIIMMEVRFNENFFTFLLYFYFAFSSLFIRNFTNFSYIVRIRLHRPVKMTLKMLMTPGKLLTGLRIYALRKLRYIFLLVS